MYCPKCRLTKVIKDKDNRIVFDNEDDVVVIQHYQCPECKRSYIKTTYNKRYREQWVEINSDEEL